MTPAVRSLAEGGDEVVHHLLVDLLAKAGIVCVAALVLVVGMVIVWRTVGKRPHRDRE